jgi:hypothetical protein
LLALIVPIVDYSLRCKESHFQEEEEEAAVGELGPCSPPSPFLISANKLLKGPVILNVGGKK